MEAKSYIIVMTDDGSASVRIDGTDITFHSTRGAIQESAHVFIGAGLNFFSERNADQDPIRVFEAGFGTGLNALLTAKEAHRLGKNIEYETIDLHPLPENLFFKLNYGEAVGETELYRSITQTGWNQKVFISPFFKLKKIVGDLRTYAIAGLFDVVYFDAFAPNDQPELWTGEIFKRLYGALNSGGVLVTYCSKSIVRKNLESAGFKVEKLEGPPGKREIIRAVKA